MKISRCLSLRETADTAKRASAPAADTLGSEVSITNSTGTTCFDADFYLFGGEKVFTNNCPPTGYKFAGMEHDSETGLDHTLNRQYSSQYGRWLSPDPMGGDIMNPQSLNRYAYVLNNPIAFTDPLGLSGGNPADFCSDPSDPNYGGAQCQGPPTCSFVGDPNCAYTLCEYGSIGVDDMFCMVNMVGDILPPVNPWNPLPAITQPTAAGQLGALGNTWVSNTITAPSLYCHVYGGVVPGSPGNINLPCFVIKVTTDAKFLKTLSKAILELDHLSSRYVTLPYLMILSGTVVAGTSGVTIAASLAAGPEGWVLLPVEGVVFVGGTGLAVEGIDFEITGHFSLLDKLNRALNPVPAH